jgi:hypothetical protein
MKKENVKAINSQMKTLAKEVEGILDIGERANARAKYIELLFNISVSGALENGCSCGGNCSCGKDAIKEDIPKEVEEPMVEETEEEPVEQAEEEVAEETTEETEDPLEDGEEVEDEAEEKAEEADPLEDSEEVEQDAEADERITYETEEGEVLDVTDIYNQITDVEDPEEKRTIAGYIAEYDNCIDEYNSLSMLESSGTKIYLAYCINFYGLDEINECVAKLTENEFTDVYKYITDNNVEGFTQYVDQTFDDEDEE